MANVIPNENPRKRARVLRKRVVAPASVEDMVRRPYPDDKKIIGKNYFIRKK